MKILLATDGTECSEAAVSAVARRPWPVDTEVRVLSVVEPPAPLVAEPYMLNADYFREVEKVKRAAAAAALERATAALGHSAGRLRVSTETPTGSPRRVIVEEAEKWGADLIVVGSHGRRTWERMLLGSVSQTAAARADCPVEIVR